MSEDLKERMCVVHLYRDNSLGLASSTLGGVINGGMRELLDGADPRYGDILVEHDIPVIRPTYKVATRMQGFINKYLCPFQGPQHASYRAHPYSTYEDPAIYTAYFTRQAFPNYLPIPDTEIDDHRLFMSQCQKNTVQTWLPSHPILRRSHREGTNLFQSPLVSPSQPVQFDYSTRPFVWPLLTLIRDGNADGPSTRRLKYRPWTEGDGPVLCGMLDAMHAIRTGADVELVDLIQGDHLELPPPFGPRCEQCLRLLRPTVPLMSKPSVPRWCHWCPAKFRRMRDLLTHQHTIHGPDRKDLECPHCTFWFRTVWYCYDYVNFRIESYADYPTFILSIQP